MVRENSEGEYSEIGGRHNRGTAGELAVQEAIFTRTGVTRIADYAFDLAERRAGRVTSATKSNGIVHTMPFWDEVVAERAAAHPGVTLSSEHIDALCAKLVLDPGRFDVIVGSNLFGDILSDLAAAVAGSIGMAPSANIDPTREFPSMFEPVHGSAPDIAGRGVANPIGAIWTGALLLEHLGHAEAAAEVVEAIAAVLARGDVRTGDLGGRPRRRVTSAVTDALGGLSELRAAHRNTAAPRTRPRAGSRSPSVPLPFSSPNPTRSTPTGCGSAPPSAATGRHCCCCTAIRRPTSSGTRSPRPGRASSPWCCRPARLRRLVKPAGTRHYSKRAMAPDQVEVMEALGFERFPVVGHDRGGRVGHRLALDAPGGRRRWRCSTSPRPAHVRAHRQGFRLGYFHWFFLAAPTRSPERLIAADPDSGSGRA